LCRVTTYKSGFGKLLGGDGADESKMDEAARPGTARSLTASNEPAPLAGILFPLGVQGYALDAPADGICNSGGAAEIH
jgi:hypothetical protein